MPSPEKHHVKGVAKKVKQRFRNVKARLSSGSHKESDQTSSNHSGHSDQGPLWPVLAHLTPSSTISLSIPPVVSHSRSSSDSMASHPGASKDSELFASPPSSVSEVERDGAPSTIESEWSNPPGELESGHEADEAAERVQDEGEAAHPFEDASTSSPEPVAPESAIPIVVEPEVPDPFLVDDPDDPLSESEPPTARLPPHGVQISESQVTIAPAEEISLSTQTPPPQSTPISSQPDINKPVPAPPARPTSYSDSSGSDAPAIYLPQLVLPTMFLPIPNTDPLTTLLTKYISNPEKRPQRDLTGEWTRTDFHTLVMTNSWRALARMARDRLVQTDPEDLNLVLSLWYLRLSSLARLRLFNQTSAETTTLFSALSSVTPPTARTHVFENVLPFELEVIHARVKYWAGDPLGYMDALGMLLRKCRRKARAARGERGAGERQMWMERGARVALIAASQFIEVKDFVAATKLLEPLLNQPDDTHELRSAIGRIYLQAGQLFQAEAHFAAVAADSNVGQTVKDMNAVILASAKGEWGKASAILRELVDSDKENYAAVNDLAVVLLSEGKLKEGIEVLESALQSSPSTLTMAEPFLFNLSTLYELRSAVAADSKRELLVEVSKWSGDGLRTTCLKMPSN